LFERRLGNFFVGLAWLTILLFLALGLRSFLLELRCRNFLSVFRIFVVCAVAGNGNMLLSSRGHHNFFVRRWAHAIFCLSHAVGVGGSCGAFAVFCLSGGEKNILLSRIFTFFWCVWLSQFCVGAALSDFPVGLSQFFV
jgi:hypothetical protein